MRAYQFVTLFLVITVVCGCSHRRVHRRPISTSSCACDSCRFEKEQLIESGAIPADYFGHSEAFETVEPESKDSATASSSSILSPEYSSDVGGEVVTESPFFSGNPVDMDSEAPESFVAPSDDDSQAPSGELLLGNIPELNLKTTSEIPLVPSSTQDAPESDFRPVDSELSEIHEPELSLPMPPATQQLIPIPVLEFPADDNDFRILDSAVFTPRSPEGQLEVTGVVSEEIESQPYTHQPIISNPLPQLAFSANRFAPKLAQQSEAVVEDELYEEPIAQQPVEHQSIVQDSKLDPVYGLPLSNNVSFNSLPTIEAPMTDSSAQAQHLQVHIHHEYGSAAGLAQGHTGVRDNPSATNVQVVYRDDQGRIVMAPPAKIDEPVGDQRTYYIPPEQILRLKAVSPIDQPQSAPSVASIQMRDTIVQGGKHLLTIPEHRTRSVQMSHGLPGIDHEKLREAFQAFPTANPLR